MYSQQFELYKLCVHDIIKNIYNNNLNQLFELIQTKNIYNLKN